MGLTLTTKDKEISFNMSASGFFRLRYNIALAYDEEFAKQYAKLPYCLSDEESKEIIACINKILQDDRFSDEDNDLLDFFFASDCEGEASYKVCEKMYHLIKDIDFGKRSFIYVAYSDGNDYEHLKEFLKKCSSQHSNMIWY